MLKQRFVAAIGVHNYIHYVTFLTDLYHSACLPFKAPGRNIVKHYLVPRGGTVLDIGANTGRFTAFVAPLVGTSGRVYSFEPVLATLRVLKWVVALRRFRHVVIVATALSDDTGLADMTIPLKQGWKPQLPIAYLGGLPTSQSRQERVRVQRLDDFCNAVHVDRIDLIKCDTEGHEYFVFAGGLKTLAQHRPSIFCEIAKPYLDRQHLDPSAVFELLKTLGYQSYLPTAQGTLIPVEGYRREADYTGYSEFKFHQVLTRVPARRLVNVIYHKGMMQITEGA